MILRCLLFLFVFISALYSADPPAKLETATPIEICSSCKDVRVLLVPDQNSAIKIGEQPEVEHVLLGAAPRDPGKFQPKWIGTTFPRAIDITLDPLETNQAGTYDLYFNLQPNSNPGAERLKVQLIRPAAAVQTIPKLIVDRTYWFIHLYSDSHPDLRVTETSKKSSITISGVRPVSNTSVGTRPIGGTLSFPLGKQPAIAPGAQANLDYDLQGDFELGSATGTMMIDAPQLAQPIPFDFEVRSRVHWIYLGITIAVGLLMSYFVKVKLQQTIELDQARLDAQTLLEKVNDEQTRHADPNFRTLYSAQLQSLTTALNGNSAIAINDAKVALDAAWRAALQDLAKRRQDQLEALNKLREVTNRQWLVAAEIGPAIDKARTAQTAVMAAIDADDVVKAQTLLANVITTLGTDLRTAALGWQSKQQEILKALMSGIGGVSGANTTALAKPATDVQASLNKVQPNTVLDTPEQIQQSLRDLEFERTSVLQFFQWLSSAIEMEASTAAAQILSPAPRFWDNNIFVAASVAVKQFTTFLRSLADNPDTNQLPQQGAAVHRAWTVALQNQFPAPDASVQAQLDARDYVRATAIAFQKKSPIPANAAAVVAGPTTAEAGFLPPEFRLDAGSTAPLPVYSIRTVFQTVATPAAVVRTSVTAAQKLRKDKFLQSLIVGLLLIFVGYGLQQGTFVGTYADFSTWFFWAFGLDLTVDQVLKAAKKAA